MQQADVIVLSPHCDDAALSLGGFLAGLGTGSLRVLVVTLCSEGTRGAERREEDRAAAQCLGAEVQHAGFLDAPYRLGGAYEGAGLFGRPAPEDPLAVDLVSFLREVRGEHPVACALAPLGVGGHVDHVLCHEAARRVWGAAAVFYEDQPYAARDAEATARRLAEIGPFESRVFDVRPFWERKMAAVRVYATQVPLLFGSEQAMERCLRGHAARVALRRHGLAERLFV
jgi:LmbE family N-acetylglucosaminyl deacetylase